MRRIACVGLTVGVMLKRTRFSHSQLWLVAILLSASEAARLEVTRQPVGNTRKGFPLAQQPKIEILLGSVDEILPAGVGTVDSFGQKIDAPLHRVGQNATRVIDVTKFSQVDVAFGSNPVGARFSGGLSKLSGNMVLGVAEFSDIEITAGGVGFTLIFTVVDGNGQSLTVESDPFDCGGREARLVIVQQPMLVQDGLKAVPGRPVRMTPAILNVVDQYSRILTDANPLITASFFVDPSSTSYASADGVDKVMAHFSDSSVPAVRTVAGVATMDQLFLSRAVTEHEKELPLYLQETKSTKYQLRFSSPSFPDVISQEFETMPLLKVDRQPVHDHTRVVSKNCTGTSTGCTVHLSNYLNTCQDLGGYLDKNRDTCAVWAANPEWCLKQPHLMHQYANLEGVHPGMACCVCGGGNTTDTLEKLQTAHLYVDVACTDLDGPEEMVTSVHVANRKLTPRQDFSTGPWVGCGFAGCRDQCDTNMRNVVSKLNVKDDIGSYDGVTKVYKSMGLPLRVNVSLTDKVNICPCDGQPLKMTVRLVVTWSQTAKQQSSPMPQQPRLLLLNADGSKYTLRRKYVSVTFATSVQNEAGFFNAFDAATAFGNPAGALLLGNTRVLSEAGVAQFTDLAISEGGKGFVLRFTVSGVYSLNASTSVDSEALNVGTGNFPQLTIDCIDCSRPAPSRAEGRGLSQAPQIELLRTNPDGTSKKTPTDITVVMGFGKNGPKGVFSADTVTVRPAVGGSLKFLDVNILNGNCAFCPNSICGEGYTLMFLVNDVALETQHFDIAGGNRSPRFISPTPSAGSTFSGVLGVPRTLFTLNVTDDNHNNFVVSLTDSPAPATYSCVGRPKCLEDFGGAFPWGRQLKFEPQANDDECTRPLFAGNGPSFPKDGLYVGANVPVTFAATCKQAADMYPPPAGGKLASEQVCFRPTDEVDTTDPPYFTQGEERCFVVEVLTPVAPFFVKPFKMNHTTAGIGGIASPSPDQAAKIAAKIAVLQFSDAPVPSYLPPDAANSPQPSQHASSDALRSNRSDPLPPSQKLLESDLDTLHIGAGCRLVLPLAAAEVQAGVLSSNAIETQLMVRPLRSVRSSLYEQVQLPTLLPEGARFHAGAWANPHVSSFEFEPMRGQEGFVYTVCFEIVANINISNAKVGESMCRQRFYTSPYFGAPGQFCLDIHVERCKYCVRFGESFESLARDWGTTVMQLWASNFNVLQPNLISIGTLLNVGIVYTADVEDRLPQLAQQMGRTVNEVLGWNPDLPKRRASLLNGRDILISSATMYESRQAPWAVQNGTFVADSQSICLLPNICTFAPVVQERVVPPEYFDAGAPTHLQNETKDLYEMKDALSLEAALSLDSFSCSSCHVKQEFCTGAMCVAGQGDAPWEKERCTKYVGSRCERCVACREEEVNSDGHIIVAGTYQSSGCDGLPLPLGRLAVMAEEKEYVTCKDCTPDASCLPCTVCLDGEVEVKACTPSSNRVCVPVGQTKDSFNKIIPAPYYTGFFLPAPK